jgi:hypothetical protein
VFSFFFPKIRNLNFVGILKINVSFPKSTSVTQVMQQGVRKNTEVDRHTASFQQSTNCKMIKQTILIAALAASASAFAPAARYVCVISESLRR